MPSRADVFAGVFADAGAGARVGLASRLVLEWALRAIAIAVLALLLWRAMHPSRAGDAAATARSSTLDGALAAWTRQPPTRATVTLDSVPTPVQRDWLAALRHAGVDLAWSGLRAAPVALSVTPLADPAGAWEIDVGTARGARLAVSDGLGVLDSMAHAGGPVERVVVPRVLGGVTARGVDGSASAPPRDSLVLRRILVEGAASWETRFTVAALQERGWGVDALMHVAPNVDVRVGTPVAPDTSRYAAAVAVDTAARVIGGTASRFVRSGGGLVTLHDAATVGPTASAFLVLERGGVGDVRAARVGAGRVVRVSYPDLWRMRMATDDPVTDPVARHREWLARIVAAAAYAPRLPARSTWADDPAPYTDMIARLGAPSRSATPVAANASSVVSGPSDALLATLLALSLLGEWLSRRLRGAR